MTMANGWKATFFNGYFGVVVDLKDDAVQLILFEVGMGGTCGSIARTSFLSCVAFPMATGSDMNVGSQWMLWQRI